MPSASHAARPDAGASPATTLGRVHAIVVNFRTPELTVNAVGHLLASETPGHDLHVTLVDNGSGDGSAELLAKRFPQLRLIASPENLGFSGGNNLALREILNDIPAGTDRQHDYILLLNSDTEVEPQAVETCARFLDEHQDVGIVGPKVVLPDGRLDLACRRGFPTPARAFCKLTGLARRFPTNARFTGYNLTHLDEDQTTEVDSVVGAFMLVRLSAIDQAGLLDERFFMYGEDLDWAYRIKQRGWKVYYYPAARVRHLKGATTSRQPNRMVYEFYRAMWLFHRKHYAKSTLFLINWLVLAGIVARGSLAMLVNAARPVGARRQR